MTAQKSHGVWHQPGCYDDTGAPDAYVLQDGQAFLREHLAAGDIVADLGCWTGRHVGVLRDIVGPFGRVLAVDRPEASGRLAELRHRHPGVDVLPLHLTDLESIETSSVHGGLWWRVAHNLTRPGELAAAFGEIHRVLRPGAPLLAAVRAVREGQDLEFDQPQFLFSRVAPGIDRYRGDLYFSENAAERLFMEWGFAVRLVTETIGHERIDGVAVSHRYLVVHAQRVNA